MFPQPPSPPSWQDLLKNAGQGIMNSLLPKTPTPTTSPFGGASAVQPIQGYNYTPYQIQPNDTFDTIAMGNGTTPQALQQANGLVVPPPKGSYISVPNLTSSFPNPNNPYAPLVQQGGYPPAPQQAATQPVRGDPRQYDSRYGGVAGTSPVAGVAIQPGGGADRGGAYFNDVVRQIQAQLETGTKPPSVPSWALRTFGETPETMTQAGYIQDAAGNFVLPGANVPAVAPSGATPFGVTSSGQRLDRSGNVWDPATAQTDIYGGRIVQEGARRWARDARGRLRRQVASQGKWRDVKNKREHQAAPVAEASEASNAGTTPTQTLANMMGGG